VAQVQADARVLEVYLGKPRQAVAAPEGVVAVD
jgi:hypothetical protein